MVTSKTGTVGKPLSLSGKVNTVNKVDGITNVHCTKTAEELDIPMRKRTGRILEKSGRGEKV